MMYGPSHLTSSLPAVVGFAIRFRTMSPGAKGRSLTLLLYARVTPSVYFDIVEIALSRCSSRRSMDVCLSAGSGCDNARRDFAVNSAGVMASSPKRSLNGENPVGLVGVVRSAHRAF